MTPRTESRHERRTALLAGLLLAAACDGISGGGEPARSLTNVAYGPDPAQVLDLELPAGRTRNTPVIGFIHGGGWNAGDKSVFTATDLKKFTDRGYACVNLNYRLASTIANIHDPLLSEDITAALDFVAAHAEEYRISGSQFGLVGHSAGGQLALLAGYQYNPTGRIKAIASLAGPTDLTDPLFLAIPSVRTLIENYLGVTQAEAPARWTGASPVSVATTSAPPTILLHGALDILVPVTLADRLRDRLQVLGVPNDYQLFPVYTHDLGYLLLNHYPDAVWAPVLDWFDRYVR